ncbi:C-type lectin domain family 4 member E-like [Acropora muricata]|uniref:C-type lectin domain family 4 member E-like n=1 Tax=Acropora muricata TaxID=159855 RepID=UPI0034E4855B
MESLKLLPRGLLFVFAFLPACISKADHATVMISRGGNIRESGFAYFIEEKFSHLNIAPAVKRVAENSLSCAFSCLRNLACFSFNFAAFPDQAGKFTCEILSSDKYNNSEKFLPSKTFHHFSVVSPCSNLPCRNKGKCVTLYETNSYVCACKKIFTGKHCENYTCPPGFVIHGESCYYVASPSFASTWDNSRRHCQNLGADLAVIKSEDENQFFYHLLRNTSDGLRDGWIGLYRKADNKFYWLDDRPAEGNYQRWGKGEPSGGGENCVHLRGGDSGGTWNDLSCLTTYPVAICQWPI